jgi:hypothetical protein
MAIDGLEDLAEAQAVPTRATTMISLNTNKGLKDAFSHMTRDAHAVVAYRQYGLARPFSERHTNPRLWLIWLSVLQGVVEKRADKVSDRAWLTSTGLDARNFSV